MAMMQAPPAGRAPYPPQPAPQGQPAPEEQSEDPIFDEVTNNLDAMAIDEQGTLKPEMADALGTPIKEGRDPAESLAHLSATLVTEVMRGGMEAGIQLSGSEHAEPAMQYVVQMLATIAAQEGIHDYSEDDMVQAIEQGGELMFQQTQEIGIWDEAQVQEDFNSMVQENQSGGMDQAFAELQQMGGGAPAGGPPVMGGAGG